MIICNVHVKRLLKLNCKTNKKITGTLSSFNNVYKWEMIEESKSTLLYVVEDSNRNYFEVWFVKHNLDTSLTYEQIIINYLSQYSNGF